MGGISTWADTGVEFRVGALRAIAAEVISQAPPRDQICRDLDSYTRMFHVLSAVCSTESEEMDAADELIRIFWNPARAQIRDPAEITTGLDQMKELSWRDRLQYKLGAKNPEFTLRQLRQRSCRAYMKEQLRCGARPEHFYQIFEAMRFPKPFS